jgi:vitamin B12 transporter
VNALIVIAAAAAQPQISAEPQDGREIVVTASLVPVPADETPASVTVFDEARIEALGPVFATDIIRLSPGVSVSTSGGAGSLADVRIRGAEANHTLLFVDGIAYNDIAAGNQPRFDTLLADGLGRLELIRGPQSALWGSEALGGVIAVETPEPFGRRRGFASAEYGERHSANLSAALASGGEKAGVSATVSRARSEGIDILGGGAGDKDGFDNFTASVKGAVRPASDVELGAVARYVHHRAEFDGVDAFFRRADTPEEQFADTYAARFWLSLGLADGAPWAARLGAQHLDSRNRNWNGSVHTNDTSGRRTRFNGQATRRFALAGARHEFVAAVERENEDFSTRDRQAGATRDLDRARTALIAEWRASWGDERLVTDVALRHDAFNRFRDDTTLRANVVLRLSPSLSAVGGYGEGIAQPTFFDLFGFAPNSGFVANPALKPERSRGFEGGLRWRGPKASFDAVAFSNDLRDEIVEDFSPFPNYTVVNAAGKSRRRGLELSGEWRLASGVSLGGSYSYIDTRELGGSGGAALREVRRPRHSGSLYGSWSQGPLTLGASLAYVGRRIDRDFDLFPAPRVALGAYTLGSARIAYRITRALEAYVRADNAFDARYRDVVGYSTPGRAVYAGLRLRLGD